MIAVSICFNEPVSYGIAMSMQEKLVAARIAGEIPDVVILLEHNPVVTLGTRARMEHILASPEDLARSGVGVEQTNRGGDVTWHGPGQLVIYPIMRPAEDARGHLYNLEEIAIRTARDFGVPSFRRKGLTGVWTSAGKLAAIGVRFKRWVAFHGMSFNVNPDLNAFESIVPCGLADRRVTSLQHSLSGMECPSMGEVMECMKTNFSEVCNRALKEVSRSAMGIDKMIRDEMGVL